jgi:hypothetical protein
MSYQRHVGSPMKAPPTQRHTQRGFIGRAQEARELETERHHGTLGEPRMALILGDARLDKTQLTSELLPDDEPTLGLTTRSSHHRGISSFNHWTQTLSQHIHDPTTGKSGQARENRLDDQPTTRGVERTQDATPHRSEQTRHRLPERVVDLLTTLSADPPVIVIIDDAYWSEDTLWKMLPLLSSDYPKHRLPVLITAHPQQLTEHRNTTKALSILEQHGLIHRAQLDPLTAEDIHELATTPPPHHIPSALIEYAITRSRGIPIFAIGLLKALADQDTNPTQPEFDSASTTLADWVSTTVMRLDPSRVPLVEMLTIVGGPLHRNDLAQIAGTPLTKITLPMERLVRAGMVIEQGRDGPLSYALIHTLAKEALDTRVEDARQRVWHQRAAGTPQRRNTWRPQHPASFARRGPGATKNPTRYSRTLRGPNGESWPPWRQRSSMRCPPTTDTSAMYPTRPRGDRTGTSPTARSMTGSTG